MRKNILQKFHVYGCLYLIFLCITLSSCNDNDLVGSGDNPGGTASNGSVKKLLENALTSWGIDNKQIIDSMDNYSMLSNSDKSILQFKMGRNDEYITYRLYDGKLSNTTVLLPTLSDDFKLNTLLEGYTFVGELNNCIVYENLVKNTMAMLWRHADDDSLYSAIGFSPIQSDAYQSVDPITLITEDTSADIFTATFSGSVSGVTSNVEVGFIYDTVSNLSETAGTIIKTTSQNKFSLGVKGLKPETTYYYCAYAVVDGIYYLGETKSFKTKPFTYTIDGSSYKMIKVEGGDMPSFYIMEVELPPNSDLIIGNNNFGRLNIKLDGVIVKSEFREFLNDLRDVTGLPFRLPTKEEWMFAAKGGIKSAGYIYSGSNNINEVAWFKGNCSGSKKIATKLPNELGLYDMSGNFAEVCSGSDDLYYVDGPICGGSWKDQSNDCKSTSWHEGSREGIVPGNTTPEKNAFDASYISMRLVYSIEE